MKWNDESQKELHRAQVDERRGQDHQVLHEQLLKQNWDLLVAHEQILNETEEISFRVLPSTKLQDEE